VGEAEILEHVSHGEVVDGSRGLNPTGAELEEVSRDQLRRFATVALAAVGLVEDADADLEDARRKGVLRIPRGDVPYQAALRLDAEVEPPVDEPTRVLDALSQPALDRRRRFFDKGIQTCLGLGDRVELVDAERPQNDPRPA
jgi:hypothetical protein